MRLIEGARTRIDYFGIEHQAQRMLDVYDQATIARQENRYIRVRD